MKQQQQWITGAKVFDGDELRDGLGILVDNETIAAVLPANQTPKQAKSVVLSGGILAPGFIDVQVNGGGGIMVIDDPSIPGIQKVVAAHRKFGTTNMMPTIMSDTKERMSHAVKLISHAAEANLVYLEYT